MRRRRAGGASPSRLSPALELSLTPLSVARSQEVAGEVGIKAMPTFALFKNGEKVGTVVGADPNKLKAALEHHSVASA